MIVSALVMRRADLELAPIAAKRMSLRTAVLVGCSSQSNSLLEKRVVLALALVPDRHMRRDVLLLDHPAQHGPVP